MSTFAPRRIPCPTCGHVELRQVAVTLNGGRMPELRGKILDGTFQRAVCEACRAAFTVEEPFVYVDFGRKHWITCFPPHREPAWRALEWEPMEDWQGAMVRFAAPAARDWTEGFVVRAVFGLAALREKLLCLAHAIDDRWLAVLQLDAMRRFPLFSTATRPRLVEVRDDALVHDAPGAPLALSSRRLAELRADPLAWLPAYEAVGRGPYVDVGRVLIGGHAVPAE